jgi:plasmid stabilization system protein ParE
MLYTVKLLPEAERDILSNMLWWAENHSAEQATDWHDVVSRQIQQVANAPESHGLSAESPFFHYQIRDALIGKGRRGSYRAIFTIVGNEVVVLRVLRASQGKIMPHDVSFPE